MKALRIVNLADLHLDSDPYKANKAIASLDQIFSYCEKNPVDYIKIDGDLWNVPQREPYYETSKEGRGVEIVKYYLTQFSKLVKYVVITRGNSAHDAPGSIKKLHQLYAPNILAFEYPLVLGFFGKDQDLTFHDLFRDQKALETILNTPNHVKPELLIPLMPYPNKSMLMEHAKSIDDSNEEYGEIFDGLMTAFGGITSKFDCPKVMGFHGNVQGCRLSNGQTLLGQDIIISPQSLMKAKVDYYNLGHIHLPQDIVPGVMGYCGSLYNVDWGETEQKSFTVVEFDENKEMKIERIPMTAVKPMIIVKAEFKNGELVYAKPEIESEIRLDFDIPESDLALLTDDKKEKVIADLGGDVKINKNVVRVERVSRSEKIMDATTEEEEVTEYLNAVVFAENKKESGLPVEEIGKDGNKKLRVKLPGTMITKIGKIRDTVAKEEKVDEV